jgi:hypothetical protein
VVVVIYLVNLEIGFSDCVQPIRVRSVRVGALTNRNTEFPYFTVSSRAWKMQVIFLSVAVNHNFKDEIIMWKLFFQSKMVGDSLSNINLFPDDDSSPPFYPDPRVDNDKDPPYDPWYDNYLPCCLVVRSCNTSKNLLWLRYELLNLYAHSLIVYYILLHIFGNFTPVRKQICLLFFII